MGVEFCITPQHEISLIDEYENRESQRHYTKIHETKILRLTLNISHGASHGQEHGNIMMDGGLLVSCCFLRRHRIQPHLSPERYQTPGVTTWLLPIIAHNCKQIKMA